MYKSKEQETKCLFGALGLTLYLADSGLAEEEAIYSMCEAIASLCYIMDRDDVVEVLDFQYDRFYKMMESKPELKEKFLKASAEHQVRKLKEDGELH